MGRTQAEHMSNINEVMNRLTEADMRLKKDKCVFMAPAVEYFRHRITKANTIQGRSHN